MTDEIRAGIIAFANALLPFLVLIGAVDLDEKGLAGAGLVVTTGVTLLGLIFAKKRAATP